ncbi:MAG: permease, partial [Paracoccaceae bacterium]
MSDRGLSWPTTISARLFGWAVLATLLAFLINNILMVAFDFPSITFADGIQSANFIQIAIYMVGLVFAVSF